MPNAAYVRETAQPFQGSYWPNVPPVLAPEGYYWYNYGPVGRNMNYYRAIQVGTRPSAADQAQTLAKHRSIFHMRAPEGLKEALAAHGLELPPDPGFFFAGRVLMWTIIGGVVALVWRYATSRRR